MIARSDVVDTIRLEPDAGLVKSLGAHHTFESAIADLVDNCLDAGARRIAVRLLTNAGQLVQVEVVDDGKGMDAGIADNAMRLGHRRNYDANALGHFGIGMKAASFGHCDVLTVWSSKNGAIPVGRRIRRADFSKDFSCERLSPEAAAAAQEKRERVIGSAWGTTVVWSGLRSTYRGASIEEAETWMANTELKVRSHLGVIFHRLIEKGHLAIRVYVDELEYADQAIGTPVKAIDPFGYAVSGRPGYPKTITAISSGQQVALQCHIWPPKTDIPGFRIQGRSGERFQGFYVYRNDRLLQMGGWSDVANTLKKRELARVAIDDAAAIGTLLTMNPEKAGMRFEPAFRDALAHARASDRTTFDQFLTHAEMTYGEAHRRVRRRHPVITPDRGFAPAVRRQIAHELGLLKFRTLGIRWTRMADGEFFDVDVGKSELLLNQRYRPLFAPGRGSLNDAPVVKALLFLLTHDVFEGTNMGPKDKDNVALWRAVLGAAVLAEEDMRGD